MLNNNLNVAVIGSGGALGTEFVRQLALSNKVKSIYAFSSKNTNFADQKISSHLLNIENEAEIENAAKIASKEASIDMVIIAIGMLHNEELKPEKALRDLKAEKFHKIFSINTIAPAIIAKYFLPKLTKDNNSIFAALSARVGSISDNSLGGWYAYRASKAALNMLLKNSAIEIKRTNKKAIILALHPGTVDSNLSKPFQGAVPEGKLFSPQYAVEKLLSVINNASPTDSGSLIDFNGITLDF
jgi:NAD(P)-dependent dehydrogenase (short-subunit alcohol dehydrogenase family)